MRSFREHWLKLNCVLIKKYYYKIARCVSNLSWAYWGSIMTRLPAGVHLETMELGSRIAIIHSVNWSNNGITFLKRQGQPTLNCSQKGVHPSFNGVRDSFPIHYRWDTLKDITVNTIARPI